MYNNLSFKEVLNGTTLDIGQRFFMKENSELPFTFIDKRPDTISFAHPTIRGKRVTETVTKCTFSFDNILFLTHYSNINDITKNDDYFKKCIERIELLPKYFLKEVDELFIPTKDQINKYQWIQKNGHISMIKGFKSFGSDCFRAIKWLLTI